MVTFSDTQAWRQMAEYAPTRTLPASVAPGPILAKSSSCESWSTDARVLTMQNEPTDALLLTTAPAMTAVPGPRQAERAT